MTSAVVNNRARLRYLIADSAFFSILGEFVVSSQFFQYDLIVHFFFFHEQSALGEDLAIELSDLSKRSNGRRRLISLLETVLRRAPMEILIDQSG